MSQKSWKAEKRKCRTSDYNDDVDDEDDDDEVRMPVFICCWSVQIWLLHDYSIHSDQSSALTIAQPLKGTKRSLKKRLPAWGIKTQTDIMKHNYTETHLTLTDSKLPKKPLTVPALHSLVQVKNLSLNHTWGLLWTVTITTCNITIITCTTCTNKDYQKSIQAEPCSAASPSQSSWSSQSSSWTQSSSSWSSQSSSWTQSSSQSSSLSSSWAQSSSQSSTPHLKRICKLLGCTAMPACSDSYNEMEVISAVAPCSDFSSYATTSSLWLSRLMIVLN